MSREEEIEQVAKDIARKFYNEENPELAYRSVRQGILWADQHSREGLWDSKKVIEWIKSNEIYYEHDDVDIFVDDLRKAMEE